jgi:hypothetical protein
MWAAQVHTSIKNSSKIESICKIDLAIHTSLQKKPIFSFNEKQTEMTNSRSD